MKQDKRTALSQLIIVVTLLVFNMASYAEDVNETGWRITPYAWLPISIDLDSTVDGTTVPIDMGLDDVFDTFDVFALSARAEYWWGQYGVVVDGIWTDLQGKDIKNPAPPIDTLKIDVQDGILDLLAVYRFAVGETGSIRLSGGGRYHYIKQEVTITPTASPTTPQILGGSKDFFEILLGAQWVQPFANNWICTVRGDVSGFGIGNGSDMTASAMAGVGYEFAKHWAVELGYRYYYIDYMDGSGADAFGQEGNMHGPWIGFAYQR